MEKNYQLAIVGFGPRGLYALERFVQANQHFHKDKNSKIILFEDNPILGTGKAWKLDQPDVNWINIADRALEPFPSRPSFVIQQTSFPEFPCYLDWLASVKNHQVSDTKDVFHPRKVMGAYLMQRAQSLLERLQSLDLIEIVKERVTSIKKINEIYSITTTSSETTLSQYVLLTLGHLKTEISEQNQKFKDHARKEGLYFSAHSYSDKAADIYASAKAIAVKGLGLSMIDIVRMVVNNYKGNFTQKDRSIEWKYIMEEEHPLIIPFSLDGLPSVPKPLGKHIDDLFSIVDSRKKNLIKSLKDNLHKNSKQTIVELLTPIALEMAIVFNRLTSRSESTINEDYSIEELRKVILNFLKNPDTTHPLILDASLPITDYIKATCEMAYGQRTASLDYLVGQTWRQLQADLYDVYSHKTAPQVMVELIKIDEQTKRYSYGPPIESLLQLLALEEAGILNLEFVSDPNIELTDDGFQLSNDKNTVVAEAMVDAIISAPDLSEITDPLIKQLIDDQLVEQLHDGLGLRVDENCMHVVDGKAMDGMYSMGRLIKGNIIGVDAILECFNHKKVDGWVQNIAH